MSDFARELYEALIKGQDEPPTPPEVLAELREWWEERDRERKERMKSEFSEPE